MEIVQTIAFNSLNLASNQLFGIVASVSEDLTSGNPYYGIQYQHQC